MMRKLIGILLAFMMAVTLCACGDGDITDQVTNIVQAEDEHIMIWEYPGAVKAAPTVYTYKIKFAFNKELICKPLPFLIPSKKLAI